MEPVGIQSTSLYSSLAIGDKKAVVKQDNTDNKEKSVKLSSDVLFSSKIAKGTIPAQSETHIPKQNIPFTIGDKKFNAQPITQGIDLQEAINISKDNKIDEIILKTEDGKLFLVHGDKDSKGSLDLDKIKEGYVGKLGDKTAKIVHINNETNTVSEGAVGPLKSTWNTVKDAGSTGIVKGIGEMGTTVVAIFVGKSLLQNGIQAVQNANGAVQAVETVNEVVKVTKGVKNAAQVAGKVGNTGKAILSTIGSGITQVGVGVVIAGAVVGTVAGTMSAIGAYKARNPKNDFTTIDMLTNPDLKFISQEKSSSVDKK
ncbi:MAG: hypothetical protein ACK4IX_04865 [Candidatus Sericytochromatia bacterium]